MGPEKRFENKIKHWLTEHGAYHVKFFANGMTKRGVPDILASINGYYVGIEVKADNGHPSELQLYNVDQIRKSGGYAWIVYPTGWSELQEKLLQLLSSDIHCRELLKEVILK